MYENSTNQSTNNPKNNLYKTSSQEYGSPWAQNNLRPENTDIKKDVVPTYS